MTHVAQIDQDSFRGRNDDGSETTATWKAAVNIDWTQAVDENFRIRFLLQEINGVDPDGTNNSATLWRNLNSGGWVEVTNVSSVCIYSLSPNFDQNDSATQQLGSGTFDDGRMLEQRNTGQMVAWSADGETEWESCIQVIGADVNDVDTIEFRCQNPAGDFVTGGGTYTNIPSITVNKGGVGTLAATATGTATLELGIFKTLAATAKGIGTLAAPIFVELTDVAIAAAATGVAALGPNTVFKTLAATAKGFRGLQACMELPIPAAIGIAALTRTKLVTRVLAAVATGVMTLVKMPGLGISATATGAPVLGKTILKTLTVTATGVMTLARFVGRGISVAATGVAALGKTIFKTLTATASGIGTIVALKVVPSIAVAIAAVATGITTLNSLYVQFFAPFAGGSGLGALDRAQTRWKRRARTWKARR